MNNNKYQIEIESYETEVVELEQDTLSKLSRLAEEKKRTVEELMREILLYNVTDTADVATISSELSMQQLDKSYIIVDNTGKPFAFIKPLKTVE
jgi:tRNA 2-selenouridine synthase SelU